MKKIKKTYERMTKQEQKVSVEEELELGRVNLMAITTFFRCFEYNFF